MSNLVLRSKTTPSQLMTPELQRRASLTRLEQLRVYPHFSLLGLGALAIVVGALIGMAGFGAPLGILGLAALATGAIWWIRMSDRNYSTYKPEERAQHIKWGRVIEARAHRQIEQTRLAEVQDYHRYVPLPVREGHKLTVKILAGIPSQQKGLAWECELERYGSNSRGSWDNQEIYRGQAMENPTVEQVRQEMEKAQESAEALEERDYQEALERHRLDALALAIQPPVASAKTQARLEADDWQRELEQLQPALSEPESSQQNNSQPVGA